MRILDLKYFSLLVLAMISSQSLWADTPIVFGQEVMTLRGVVDQVQGVDTVQSLKAGEMDQNSAEEIADSARVRVTYIPDPQVYGYNSLLADLLSTVAETPNDRLRPEIKNCIFPEDTNLAGGAERVLFLKSKLSAYGDYELEIPVSALRGECQYVIQSVYFDLAYANVYQNIAMFSENYENDVQVRHEELPRHQSVPCEFVSAEADGLCVVPNTFRTQFTPDLFILNFKTIRSLMDLEDSEPEDRDANL
jgi:hypothetical protein